MRFLYLDDSGKIHPNDPTRVVVFGGFSIDEAQWHSLVRQINGAKSNFYPKRGTPIGNPHSWEVKSSDYLTHNAWNRKKTRQFCMELGNILRRNQGSVYAVALEKRLAKPPLDESTYVPLAFQRLVVKFMEELAYCNTTGTVVCDWSTHRLDRHIANCVQSMVASRGLQSLRGGVTYGDSLALAPLQVADLIARTFRITLEGSSHLREFETRLRDLAFRRGGVQDCMGCPVDSVFRLF